MQPRCLENMTLDRPGWAGRRANDSSNHPNCQGAMIRCDFCHAVTSSPTRATFGRSTPMGQLKSCGQFTENQIMAFSYRVTWMSLPELSAASFRTSPSARQETVD